jgi:ABC-type lipoprotein release transport system permease subunit
VFLVLWGAIGIIALIVGVAVIVGMKRQMQDSTTESSRREPEDGLVA